MYYVIGVTGITCICLFISVLTKPSVRIGKVTVDLYWVIALLGAFVLLISHAIPVQDAVSGITADTAMNPLKILTLFLSMSLLSIFLDEVGFFGYLANRTLQCAGAGQRTLFLSLYIVVSVLTVFTSNDIIILTFTPFICYFSRNAGIDPVPYLFCEFVAANTWSMMFLIGNPTNIYLATTEGIDFLEYVRVMWIPTIVGGVVSFLMLYLLFRRKLKQPLTIKTQAVSISDKGLLAIGLVHLTVCTVLLVLSSYIGFDMWLITLCFAVSLFVVASLYCFVRRRPDTEVVHCLRRVPWQLVPFVLSMFILVLALEKYGVTEKMAMVMGTSHTTYIYGIASYLSANLINNIPMSVLFGSVTGNLSGALQTAGIYAAVVGSNLGAVLTPIGALAGIMWSSILKKQQVSFSFARYVLYGFCVSVPALLATLAVLDCML